ncbi:hypothetical protein SARC_11785 [Sphaeroforma arctica JP610]|uniref:Fungal lipase-type domain-containing protein n=1 Tax=Sphaeroforma arctica JP610 TaxID=667725 RepID=A0A0L0FGW0_9EUKA|nr:hypothetical protein SARC_11785 [Sphaeroforma arctica JP610]KNC75696.1 hypothetical protein SARC_11785 [Sphaeroforma arctica JP610]|eukprot:XP_014149598.1 hypothetical protein SARC_11785 [Sphaeroforma arctica JP610]
MHWMCAGSRLAYKYKPIPSTHSAGDVADDIYISTSIANPRKNVCTHVVSTEKVSKPDFSQPIRADGGSLECAPGVAEHLGNAPRGPTRVGEFREGTGRVELIPVVSRDSNPMEISPDVSEGGLNLSEKGLVGSQPRLYSYDMPLGPNLSSAQQTLIISPHAAHTLLEPIVPEALEGGTRSQIHAPSDPHTNTQQTSTPATAQTYTPAQQTDRDRREETWVEREGSCTRRRNTYDSEQVHHTRVDVERYDTSGNSVDNGRTDGNAECDAHGPRRPPDMNGEDIDTAMSRAEMSRAEMSRAEMSRAEMSRAEVPRATEARAVQEDANGKFEVVAYISDARTDTHCVVFRQQGELVVSFRGTKSSGNAMTDMQANLIPLCASTCGTVNKIWHKHTCERWSECRTKDLLVHRGFLTAYQSVRVRVLDVVRKQMASYKTETRKEMALYMTESRDVVPRERRHRILNATASTVGAASTAHVGGSEKCPTAHAMPRGDRETLYSPQNLTGDMSLECCSGPGNDKGVGGSESLCTYSGNPPQDPSGTTARVSMEDGYVSALTEARTNTHANGPTPRGYVSEMHQNTINKGGCIAKKDNYAVEVACMKTPASSMENIQGTSAAAGARERTSIILNPFLGFCKPRSDTGLRIYNRRKSQSAPDLGNETPFSVVFEPDTGLKSYDGSGLNNTKHAETGKRVYDMPEVCSGYEPSEPNNSNETTYTAQIPVQRTDLDEVHNPFHVFITGHSLGGALATLCAYEFSRVFAGAELALTVYTFGSPRVGNHQYAWLYNERIPNTYRIVNDGDPITALPPKIAGTAFLNTYKHVGTCYTLAETGSLVMNPNFIERRLQLKPKREISTHSIRQYRSFIVRCLARYVSGASGGERTKTCEAYELATALRSITSVLQAPSEMGTLELDAMEGITDGLTVPEAQSSGAKMRQLLHRTRSVDHVVYR